MQFAIFKDKDNNKYVYTPSGNPLAYNFRACVKKYGQPCEYTNRENYGDMPVKWRGKDMEEAKIIYKHDQASGWPNDAEVQC